MPRGGHNIKPPDQRVNRKTPRDQRVVEMRKSPQPPLDEDMYDWPDITRRWWDMWKDSGLTIDYTPEDWSELQDTAMLHAMFYTLAPGSPGFFKASAQLRQRTANYGVTPLDRQRLRIQFSFADEAERKAGNNRNPEPPPASARTRRGPLKVVPDVKEKKGA